MKKIMISVLMIAILSLFIVGCSSNNATTTTTQPSSIVTRTTITVTPVQPTSTTLPPKPLPDDVKSLVAKANAATSISYKEVDTKDFIYIKGDNAKRALFAYRGVKDNERYDTVFLDLKNKKAYAACTANDVRCNAQIRKKYWEVSYDEFKPGKTPLDFMKLIYEASLNSKMTKTIQGTVTINMQFKDLEGNTGEMWVDTFYGVPYEATINGATAYYDMVVVNRVADSDVMIPKDYLQI